VPAGLTGYADTSVSSGRTYTYKVMATGAGGQSDFSDEATATTPGTIVVPPPDPGPDPGPQLETFEVRLGSGGVKSVRFTDADGTLATLTWGGSGFAVVQFAGSGLTRLSGKGMVTVVGVARDVRGFRLTDVKDAGVFLPTGLDVAQTSIVARVQGDPNLARQALLEHLTRIDPNMGMIITMRTVARLETFFLQIAFSVSIMLGGLALLLTVSGLFSVLSYLVEQRTREIGVRMALGASGHAVTRLMLAQTTRPVMAGLLAGAGLAAALATAVLATPAGALISQIVHVTDPLAYLASLGVIVAACLLAAWIPAARAANVDPMRTLRQE